MQNILEVITTQYKKNPINTEGEVALKKQMYLPKKKKRKHK